jgi:predicted ATPase
MDNFRGFSKTVVPLSKTNFFVGENSSGKSSVLALIKIMTSFMFWHRPEFKTDEVNLGHSQDIISVNSKDRSYFRVGYLNNLANKEKEQENNYLFNSGFLMTFFDKNGSPELKLLTFEFSDGELLHIKFETNYVSYRIDSGIRLLSKSQDEAKVIFNNLIEFQDKNTGFTRVNKDIGSQSGLMFSVFAVLALIQKKNKSKDLMNNAEMYANVRPIWLAPIRSKPKRTYDEPTYEFSPEGEHTPYLIGSIIGNKKRLALKNLLESVGRNTGLFKEITLKRYGRSKSSPFELDVILEDKPLSILNVGYGVSQSMPILAELTTRQKKSWFIIQQPEVHLHPKAQAAIGDVLFDSVKLDEHTNLVETHSDYMIDRYRLRQMKDESKDTLFNTQILFFSRKNGNNNVYPIFIDNNGALDPNQPDSYREFFINEQMELLGL